MAIWEARFDGPIEVDETYVGGLRKNMPKSKRRKVAHVKTGWSTNPNRVPLVRIEDRATNEVRVTVADETGTWSTAQKLVRTHTIPETTLYLDGVK